MRLPVGLIVIGLLFVGWALAFAAITPYRQSGFLRYQRNAEGMPMRTIDVGAPDELQHVNYIRHLMDGKGFPVLKLDDPNLGANYQSHQPPLYYLIAAGWSRLFGADLRHDQSKLVIRSLNILIGLGAIAGVYFGLIWSFRKEAIALAGAAITGLLPMMIALHGAASNDPLLFLLCTWVVALSIRAVQLGWTMKVGLTVGALTGLALLTKTTAVALMPIVMLALYLGRNGTPKLKPGVVAATILIPLLFAAPWWMRNQQLYGDPLGLQLFTSAFQGSPQAGMFIDGLGAKAYWVDMVAWWTGRSFIGVFGYMDIFLFETMRSEQAAALYRFLLALFGCLGLASAVGMMSTQDQARKDGVPRPAAFVWLGGAFLLLIVLLFLRFNAQYFQGQARYLFPAILPIAGFLAVGAVTIFRKKPEIAWAALTLGLTALDVLSYMTIREGFPIRLGGL